MPDLAVFQPVMNGTGFTLSIVGSLEDLDYCRRGWQSGCCSCQPAVHRTPSTRKAGRVQRRERISCFTRLSKSMSTLLVSWYVGWVQKNMMTAHAPLVRSERGASIVRVLLFLVIPGHLTFVFVISRLAKDQGELSLAFIALYLGAALVQVCNFMSTIHSYAFLPGRSLF